MAVDAKKLVAAVNAVKSKADKGYENFPAVPKGSKATKDKYYSRRYNGLTTKIKKRGTAEQHEKAATILRKFGSMSGTEQHKNAHATLESVAGCYVSAGGGGGRTRLAKDAKVSIDL